MSLSCPEGHCRRLVAPAVLAALAGGTAHAAEVYYQPAVALSTSYSDNVNLETSNGQGAEGYFADAATTIGIATQRSETNLQPRLLYNYYPSVTDRNRLEAFLNMNSRYSWQRDTFSIVGLYDRRDDVNAEQPAATQNSFNPGIGETTPGTGQVRTGVVRNWLILDPTFTHLLTPLLSLGIAGEYQGLRYSPDDQSSHLSFNYYKARTFLSQTLNTRASVLLGVFTEHYDSLSIDTHSHSVGVQLHGSYAWTQTLQSSLDLGYEQIKFEELSPRTLQETSHPWSAQFATTYREQVSAYTLSVGRVIFPSGAGGLFASDQVQAQYDRDLTQRLHFTTAVRVFRENATAGVTSNNTRNYRTANVSAKYMLGPTWFISGSYTYVYQKYHSDITSAQANTVGFAFGWSGLPRQR